MYRRLWCYVLLCSAAVLLLAGGCSDSGYDPQESEASNRLFGPYMGQAVPGADPERFAPGVVSTGMYERDITLSPDGNEIYFGLVASGHTTIAWMRQVDGLWVGPEIAPFASDRSAFNFEPFITPDGASLYFLSTRAPQGEEPMPGWGHQNLWVMNREAGGWGEPREVGVPVNTAGGEYYPSLTSDGTLYFTRELAEEKKSLIFRARAVDGVFQQPEQLPVEVNSADAQFNAFIAPDESYLIYCAGGREDTVGRSDYYISFRDEQGQWSPSVNMGEPFNHAGGVARSMSLSPDGKYLFFSSSRKNEAEEGVDTTSIFYDGMKANQTSPGNGASDIWWVDASILEQYR